MLCDNKYGKPISVPVAFNEYCRFGEPMVQVILPHKLLKCRIFIKRLRRSLNAVKAIGIIKPKDLSSRSVFVRGKPNFY